jgi:2-oxo-4-hydroxy-4-carboxy-5-ureidoimidazoline decarboxylase
MAARVSLDALNAASAEAFAAALTGIFPGAPWVVAAVAASRPFATVAALHDALMAVIAACPPDRQRAFINGFPALAGQDGMMGVASTAEHAGLGFDRLPAEDFAAFGRLNAAYRARFGFPFMICVRRQTRDAVLEALEWRFGHDAGTELAAALAEIGHVARLRLADAVEGPGMPRGERRADDACARHPSRRAGSGRADHAA